MGKEVNVSWKCDICKKDLGLKAASILTIAHRGNLLKTELISKLSDLSSSIYNKEVKAWFYNVCEECSGEKISWYVDSIVSTGLSEYPDPELVMDRDYNAREYSLRRHASEYCFNMSNCAKTFLARIGVLAGKTKELAGDVAEATVQAVDDIKQGKW